MNSTGVLLLSVLALARLSPFVHGLLHSGTPARWLTRTHVHQSTPSGRDTGATTGAAEDASTAKAMAAARECEAAGLSPGAGLATAEEQAEAAYADLINTSMDQRGLELSKDDVEALANGGTMWERGSTERRTGGLLGNLLNVFGALIGGAHIEKNEFGET